MTRSEQAQALRDWQRQLDNFLGSSHVVSTQGRLLLDVADALDQLAAPGVRRWTDAELQEAVEVAVERTAQNYREGRIPGVIVTTRERLERVIPILFQAGIVEREARLLLGLEDATTDGREEA